MSFSLNETEAMARKAARGAGYPWGLADEAGVATRWLCAQGLDGVAELASALNQAPGPDAPLSVGAGLSDRAGVLERGPLALPAVSRPVMLLSFAAMAARHLGMPLCLRSGAAAAITDGTRLEMDVEFPLARDAVTVTIGGEISRPLALRKRASPDPASWQKLCDLAHRTYAPATEESRARGAGAGDTDND